MARRKSSVGGLAVIFVIALAIIIWVVENIVGILGFLLAAWGGL